MLDRDQTFRTTAVGTGPTAQPQRRKLLQGAGVVFLATVAGCDLRTEPATDQDGGRKDRKGLQAPMLAEKVEAGDLPPVNERLPEDPLIIEPTERVGVYGGVWHSALLGTEEKGYIYTYGQYDNLVRWKTDWTGAAGTEELIPNLAEEFDVNENATEFIFRLRKGIKWSDGQPFTADDVMFAVEDVLLNKEIFPVPPSLLTVDHGPATIEKLDDHVFAITFPSSAGLFLQQLATPGGHVLTHFPRHYLEKFHLTHNVNADQLAGDQGFAGWVELFSAKSGQPGAEWGENPDLATLGAWQLVTPFGEGQQVVLERNPYYWKVDPDGSQLPYIDRIVFDIVSDLEVMLLMATNGEINLEVPPKPRITVPANKPVLAKNREQGNYGFIDGTAERMNIMIIQLNLTHEDPAKRDIFQNKDFRIGLSYAINRQEMIDIAMQGQGEPYQAAPLADSPFYDEEFATQYVDYDPDRANAFLDKAFPEKDGQGLRLGPDGTPIVITIEFPPFRPEWADMLELVKGYWQNVGIDLRLKNEARTLFVERMNANKHDAAVWHGEGGLAGLLWPDYYVPTRPGPSKYAVLWSMWYQSGGSAGETPPEAPRQQMELYDQLKSSAEPAEQTRLMRSIIDIAKEQFYTIGTARESEKYFIAANNFHNVPANLIETWPYATPGPTRTEQYFISS